MVRDKKRPWVSHHRPHGKARRKSEALWLGLALVVHAVHECLEVGCFVSGDGWLIVDVVILEISVGTCRQRLALWVSHRVDRQQAHSAIS